MMLEILMFVLLFLFVGLCAGFIAAVAEDYVHREYTEPSDWPEDDDWTIVSGKVVEVQDES